MLAGHKTVMMEVYANGVDKRIDFYCPVQEPKRFWLTPFVAPQLKTDERPKTD